jgi:hypothetical protein
VGILDFGYIDKFCVMESFSSGKLLSIIEKIYMKLKRRGRIISGGRIIKIIRDVNMNYTIVDMNNLKDDSEFTVDLSPVALDSSVERIYTTK